VPSGALSFCMVQPDTPAVYPLLLVASSALLHSCPGT
jgi:hypothetical protein